MNLASFSFPIMALIAAASHYAHADNAPPINPVQNENLVQSELVSIGHGDYMLIAREKTGLLLRHSSLHGTITYTLKPIVIEPSPDQKKSQWPNSRIEEIALSRWSRKSLVAVIKTRALHAGRSTSFWFVTFNGTNLPPKHPEQPITQVSFICDGSPDDRILAVSGTRNSPAITALIGTWSESADQVLDSGMLAIHGCPSPNAASPLVGHFRPRFLPVSHKIDLPIKSHRTSD